MTTTLYGNSPYQTLSLGTIFNSMASGGVVTSGVLTIPVLTSSSGYPPFCELVLEGTGLVTTGAGSPNFQAVLIPETPGGLYQEAAVPSGSGQLYPLDGLDQFTAMPSLALTVILLPFLRPYPIGSQKLVAYNNLGGALAAGVTANLRFYGGSAG